jgi:hypothetical protein
MRPLVKRFVKDRFTLEFLSFYRGFTLGSEFFGLLLHTHFEAAQKGLEKVARPRDQLHNATSPL